MEDKKPGVKLLVKWLKILRTACESNTELLIGLWTCLYQYLPHGSCKINKNTSKRRKKPKQNKTKPKQIFTQESYQLLRGDCSKFPKICGRGMEITKKQQCQIGVVSPLGSVTAALGASPSARQDAENCQPSLPVFVFILKRNKSPPASQSFSTSKPHVLVQNTTFSLRAHLMAVTVSTLPQICPHHHCDWYN